MTRRTWLKRLMVLAATLSMAGVMRGNDKPGLEPPSAALIKRALRERRVITFAYHGHERTAEPHALGKTAEGKTALLVWQTSGGSRTEPPPGWRLFFVTEIEGLKLTDATFAKPRKDYRADGSGLKTVESEVVETGNARQGKETRGGEHRRGNH